MSELISNFLQQVLSIFGVIALFGLLFSLCRSGFCRLLGKTGAFINNYIFGIVGTPVHELSHAIFCLIFGHKIIGIDLFSPLDGDSSLGSIEYDYDDDNLYQRLGIFFVGIGPILGGSAAILILMYILVPELHGILMYDINQMTIQSNSVGTYIAIICNTIPEVFNEVYFSNNYYWIFMLLALMIASHMELSPSDISGAKFGLAVLLSLLLFVDVIVWMINPLLLQRITLGAAYFGMFIAKILIIGAIFNIALLIVALIIRIFIKIFSK